MQVIFNFFDKLKRYLTFRKGELSGIILCILVFGFAISFRNWGVGSQIDISSGLTNLIIAILLVGVSFFGRVYFQKVVALGADFQAEYRPWSFGLVLTLILVFLTNGNFWFLVPGGLIMHFMPGHRIGWVRYGVNYFGLGVMSLAGPIANVFLAMFFRTLYEVTGVFWFKTIFIFNLVFALWMMNPFPPADGNKMFFGSRLVYMFGLAFVVSSAILLYSNLPLYLSILGSFAFAWIWWLIYYIIWERFNWGGPL